MKQKKIFLIVLLCLFFLPFIVNAEECDITKITITSMEQKGIEGNTKEVEEPTFNDRSINFNLKMFEVGDAITYDMTIKNDSDEDYMIDEDTFKTDSEYIVYTLKTNDGDNVVKARSSKNVTLSVEYKKEVDSSLLTNNKFDASNSLKLSLNTSEKEGPLDVITTDNIKEIKNPLTGNRSIRLIFLILLISLIIISLTYYNKKKYNKYIMLLLFLALIPTVYAICKCDIEVESTIEIEKLLKLHDTVVGLSTKENSCVTKYEGNVTDEVGKTVSATRVYYDKCSEQRNVIFGGYCWQVIRTTETKGTKLIYNGEPVDGKCESTRENHKGIVQTSYNLQKLDSNYLYGSSFTYDIESSEFTLVDTFSETWSDSTYTSLLGKFTCKNTNGICTTLYNVNTYLSSTSSYSTSYIIDDTNYAQIGTSSYNSNYKSPAMVGYMFNKVYSFERGSQAKGSLMGNDVSYSNGVYTLLPAVGESTLGTTKDDTHHYTCNNTTGTCNKVRYYIYSSEYIELDGGENIQEAIDEMLYNDNVNTYNSSMKGLVDSWYAQSLSSNTNMLEDVVYCNDRKMINLEENGWNKDGSLRTDMLFKTYNSPNDISCSNKTDQFAVGNDKAKLIYPISLATYEDLYNLTNSNDSTYYDSLIKTNDYWWGLSPNRFFGGAGIVGIYNNGYIGDGPVDDPSGVRVVISLKSDTAISSGTGSELDPWIIQE